MDAVSYDAAQVQELLIQALETELGGVEVYTRAVKCAQLDALREEWQQYLEQTRGHVRVLRALFQTLKLDPDEQTPGRAIVAHLGQSLATAIDMALDAGDPTAAQIVAAECVVLAETKDHQNWELIGRVAKSGTDAMAGALMAAYRAVEDEEDEHLYHTEGWARELWIDSLGLPAVLPPPEEVRQVQTAAGAAHAEKTRDRMLGATSTQ